jgi:hypothetical protein
MRDDSICITTGGRGLESIFYSTAYIYQVSLTLLAGAPIRHLCKFAKFENSASYIDQKQKDADPVTNLEPFELLGSGLRRD